MALGRTIVYPYFVWAVIQQLILLAFRSYTNHTASIYDVATILVQPPMQFWFLPLFLAQVYGIFFVAGDIARTYLFTSLNVRSSTRHWWLPVAISCFLLLALMTSLIESSMQPLSALVGIAGTCCLAAFLAAKHLAGVVRLCGIFSLEIYVLHTLFSAAARIGLIRILGITNLPIHLSVGVLAGLAIPFFHSRARVDTPLRLAIPFSTPQPPVTLCGREKLIGERIPASRCNARLIITAERVCCDRFPQRVN